MTDQHQTECDYTLRAALGALIARGDTRTLDDIDEPAVLIEDLRELLAGSDNPDTACGYSEDAMVAWLVETLHYPFDFSFSTPPPVDHVKVADYWNESDNWQITPDEARSCVYEEAGIPYPPEVTP